MVFMGSDMGYSSNMGFETPCPMNTPCLMTFNRGCPMETMKSTKNIFRKCVLYILTGNKPKTLVEICNFPFFAKKHQKTIFEENYQLKRG